MMFLLFESTASESPDTPPLPTPAENVYDAKRMSTLLGENTLMDVRLSFQCL